MPNGLDYTYETLLCQAAAQYPAQKHEIKALLQCLVAAALPLTAIQLSEIMALQPGERFLDFDTVATDPYDTLELVAPFILTDREKESGGVVKLSHYSLHEYLTSDNIRQGPASYFHIDILEANAWLASICPQYLTFEVFDVSLRTELKSHILDQYNLRRYAALNWYIHIQDASGLPDLMDRCDPYIGWFVDGGRGPRCYQRWQTVLQEAFPQNEINSYSPMGFAIWAGLNELVDYLLPLIPSIDSHFLDGYTCLTIAAKHNRVSIAQELLRLGADVNHTTAEPDFERKLSPLHLAAEFAARETFDLLLAFCADPHARPASGSTPFYRACRGGDVYILTKLKEAGADVNALTYDRWTPLREAAGTGNVEVMELLRSWGAVRNVAS